MITNDVELEAAIEGRPDWRSSPVGAVYAPPDGSECVEVRPVRRPARRERFVAVIVRDGQALHALPCDTAVAAVRWAERVRRA